MKECFNYFLGDNNEELKPREGGFYRVNFMKINK